MEGNKLYYSDCHLQSFTATVTDCTQTDKGWAITLDQTAFYPEGGGQPCDLGFIGCAKVLDVREKDNEILHFCDRPAAAGEAVDCTIDYRRRFDLMQQHTGEHIVSGIIHRLFGYHNVGFHIGAELVTIDFDGPIPASALENIEKEANLAIWSNLPVRCWYPTQEELPTVSYRSKKELPWPVRVVDVPGFDKCACCGVHVAATGEIGVIKLFSCVKFHQGVRIEMACGGRALDILTKVYEQNRQVSQAFSAKIMETGAAAQKMNEALSVEKFRAAGLEKQLFARIAADYAHRENVLHFEAALTPGSVRELADAIARQCSGVAAVFSGDDNTGYQMCLTSRQADVRPLGKKLTEALGGRGGGKPEAFQGNVKATRAQILEFFHFCTLCPF